VTFRPASRDERWLVTLWAVAAVVALALRRLAPFVAGFAPICPIHALLGIPCASCGGTRAALRLARLDFIGAVAENPLVALTLTGVVVGGLASPIWLAAGRGVPRWPAVPAARWRLVAALVLAANWIYLMGHGV